MRCRTPNNEPGERCVSTTATALANIGWFLLPNGSVERIEEVSKTFMPNRGKHCRARARVSVGEPHGPVRLLPKPTKMRDAQERYIGEPE